MSGEATSADHAAVSEAGREAGKRREGAASRVECNLHRPSTGRTPGSKRRKTDRPARPSSSSRSADASPQPKSKERGGRGGGGKRKRAAADKGTKEEDEDPPSSSATAISKAASGADAEREMRSSESADAGAGAKRQRVGRPARVNHRLNNALLERARLVERELLPSVDLHYVIDRRLNKTDIEWKLRSTSIGLVVQFPHGLGEATRFQLLGEVKRRILAQSKERKRRTCLSVLKKANLVEVRAKFGGMRYTSVKATDGEGYLVLGNLPGSCEVANKLAELKSRIVPLLVHFNIELKELKEIVTQSLRGRIFTNKEAVLPGSTITARIDIRVRQFTNLERFRSDRGLMITLIHELAHAITPPDVKQVKGRGVKVSHGSLFWENVMMIARTASQIEDPTCPLDQREGTAGPAPPVRRIFELKDEMEFRLKIEQEDSLPDELDYEDAEPGHSHDVVTQPGLCSLADSSGVPSSVLVAVSASAGS